MASPSHAGKILVRANGVAALVLPVCPVLLLSAQSVVIGLGLNCVASFILNILLILEGKL